MNYDWGRVLSSLSSGLMAAGSPGGFNNFGQGALQGQQIYDQRQAQKGVDQYRQLQTQALQQQLEQERLANTEKANQQKALADYFAKHSPGMMSPPTATPPIGSNGPQLSPGMMQGGGAPGDMTAEQYQFLQALPPEQAAGILGQQLFARPKAQEPYSPLAKLRDDLLNGRIDQATYDAAVKKETYITPPAQTNVKVNTGPTGIDYGQPDTGLAWARNPDGTVKLDDRGAPIALPYQGGKAYIAQQDAAASGTAKTKMAQQTADVVTDNVSRIKKEIEGASLPVTGPLGPTMSNIPGTSANNVRAMLATIKANIGIDKLQQMRNASPTGGALGQVSEQENAMLQATLGNLEQSQTREQFLYNLDKVNTIYDQIINGPGGGATTPTASKPKVIKFDNQGNVIP